MYEIFDETKAEINKNFISFLRCFFGHLSSPKLCFQFPILVGILLGLFIAAVGVSFVVFSHAFVTLIFPFQFSNEFFSSRLVSVLMSGSSRRHFGHVVNYIYYISQSDAHTHTSTEGVLAIVTYTMFSFSRSFSNFSHVYFVAFVAGLAFVHL